MSTIMYIYCLVIVLPLYRLLTFTSGSQYPHFDIIYI